MHSDIKNKKLAKEGKRRIEWAQDRMPVLGKIKREFNKKKPLKGFRIGACLHVTAETANLMRTLKAGGADVFLCASNPLSTQDEVAASLVVDFDIPVFAIKGEDNKTYYKHLDEVLRIKPNITMDDGGDLISALHKLEIANSKFEIRNANNETWEFYGSSEETTTGVIRLKAMEKDGALKVPVVAVNDSYTKYLFDNRYGTGQSTIDGILRATNILLAGKKAVVCGYGWCGRGLAMRLKGMGADVIVTEVDPLRALEAAMDGFRVTTLLDAVGKHGAELIITTTGNKHVVDKKHINNLKNGAILANSGHFNVEINMEALEKLSKKKKNVREFVEEYELYNGRRIYVLGEGRLINLVAAEGHPPDVMDLSFANQALAAKWFVENKGNLEAKVYKLPEKLDKRVSRLKLESMDIKIDKLTGEQKTYLSSWQEGT